MTARLAARLFVDALRRRTEAEGGEATILARGDATSGAVLIVHAARDGTEQAHERNPAMCGPVAWATVGPGTGDSGEVAAYVGRRRRSDPDLWVIEIAGDAGLFAAVCEMTGDT